MGFFFIIGITYVLACVTKHTPGLCCQSVLIRAEGKEQIGYWKKRIMRA